MTDTNQSGSGLISAAKLRRVIDEVLQAVAERGYRDPDFQLVVRLFLFESLRRKGEQKRLPVMTACRFGLEQLIFLLPNLVRMWGASPAHLVVVPASHRVGQPVRTRGVSKHADSVVSALLLRSNQVMVFETGVGPASYRGPSGERVVNISLVVWILQRLLGVFSRTSKAPAELVVHALEQLNARPDRVSKKRFSRRLQRHLDRSKWLIRIYSRLLRLEPHCQVVTIVYYTLDAMAVTAVARRIGCRTVEYQHGIQNDDHPMYALGQVPANLGKAATLPRAFHVWDNVAGRRAMRWMSNFPNAGFRCQVIGNLWLEQVIGTDRDRDVAGASRRVLVALQEWPMTFNMGLIAALECLDAATEVIIRPHPRDSVALEAIRSTFAQASFSGTFVIQLPGDAAIEAALARSSLCITGFSTVGVEALRLGSYCLFTHPNAKNGLADYIDGSRCFYADSEAGIRSVLMSWQQAMRTQQAAGVQV